MIQTATRYVGEPTTLPLVHIEMERQIRTRNGLDADSLNALAASIKEHGVIQPIIVRRTPDANRYVVVAGERRVLAASLAGLAEVPALIRDGTPGELRAVQAVENLQREDLSIAEIAEGLQALALDPESGGWTKIAKSLGKSPAWVSKHRATLKYKPITREVMQTGATQDLELLGMFDQIERIRTAAAQHKLGRLVAGLEDGTTTRALARLTLSLLKAPPSDTDDNAEEGEDAGTAPTPEKFGKLELAKDVAEKLLAALQYAQANKPSSRPGDELIAHVDAFIRKTWP